MYNQKFCNKYKAKEVGSKNMFNNNKKDSMTLSLILFECIAIKPYL